MIVIRLLKNFGVYVAFLVLFTAVYLLVTSIALSQLSLVPLGKELGIRNYLMPLDNARASLFAWHTWLITGALSTLCSLVYLNGQNRTEETFTPEDTSNDEVFTFGKTSFSKEAQPPPAKEKQGFGGVTW